MPAARLVCSFVLSLQKAKYNLIVKGDDFKSGSHLALIKLRCSLNPAPCFQPRCHQEYSVTSLPLPLSISGARPTCSVRIFPLSWLGSLCCRKLLSGGHGTPTSIGSSSLLETRPGPEGILQLIPTLSCYNFISLRAESEVKTLG